MALSDDESVLSETLSNFTNPFSLTAKSTTSSHPAKHTRNAATRRPAVSPKHSQKQLPHSQATILQLSKDLPSPATYGTTPLEKPLATINTVNDLADDELPSGDSDLDISLQTSTPESSIFQSSRTSLKRSRPQSSPIHEHITKQKDHFVCNYCAKASKRTSGTGAISRHLKDDHGIDPTISGLAQKRQREGTAVDVAILCGAEINVQAEVKRRKELMGIGLHKLTLEYLYLHWTITQDIPFKQVRNTHFRAFLEYINPVANQMLPNSNSTMKIHAQSLFAEGKRRLQHIFATAVSDIHITCDMWTSPNHLGLLTVVAHFTSEKFELHTVILALVEVQGEHSGLNQGEIVLEVFKQYKICNKVGYFVMDNVGSNDRLIQTVAASLNEEGVAYNADQRRLRCNGHIINLAVQAFLFGKSVDDYEYPEDMPTDSPTDAQLTQWRKLGPLGKLHNIVVWILGSSQRIQSFKHRSEDHMPH